MANIGLLVLMFLTILIVMGLSLIAILILNGAREPNDIEAINGTTLIERDQV